MNRGSLLDPVKGLPGGFTVCALGTQDADAWDRLVGDSGRFPTESRVWLECVASALPAGARFVPMGVFKEGRLTAVAPLVVGRRAGLRTIGVPGSPWVADLHDYPVISVGRGDEVQAVRSLVSALIAWADHWSVANISTSANGWIQPGWFSARGGFRARPRTTRIAPVADIAAVSSPARRNVRESLRRGRNRLGRDFPGWKVARHENGPDWGAALNRLVALQSARAHSSRGPYHPFVFGTPGGQALVRSLGQLEKHDLRIYELDIDGEPGAALLTITSPTAIQLLFSGLNDAAWDYSPITLLILRAIQDAHAEGLRRLIFPSGLDDSKRRWGVGVELLPEFTIVKSGLGSRSVHVAWAAASEIVEQRSDRRVRRASADNYRGQR